MWGNKLLELEAGLNVRCTFRSPDSFVLPLRELVKEGGLSEEVINDRVRDILRVDVYKRQGYSGEPSGGLLQGI